MQGTSLPASRTRPLSRLVLLIVTLAAVVLAAWAAPSEKTLGAGARWVYLHGAWVWAAMLIFALAAVTAAAGLLLRRQTWYSWSAALGRSGILFWLASLPLSLLMMQLNWGGFYFDEPRWRIPLTFAIAGFLVQAALLLFSLPWLTSAVNLVFGVALLVTMSQITSVLHPDSPLANPGAGSIRLFYAIMLLLLLLAELQVAAWLRQPEKAHA